MLRKRIRVADFAGIEADADDVLFKRQSLFERGECVLFGEVAQKAHNQAAADAPFGFGVAAGAGEAV